MLSKRRGTERLVRWLTHVTDSKAAVLVATGAATQIVTFFEQGIGCLAISPAAYKLKDRGSLWVLEGMFKLPDAAIEVPLFAV